MKTKFYVLSGDSFHFVGLEEDLSQDYKIHFISVDPTEAVRRCNILNERM